VFRTGLSSGLLSVAYILVTIKAREFIDHLIDYTFSRRTLTYGVSHTDITAFEDIEVIAEKFNIIQFQC
jgi:hypothetical protein